MKKSKKNPKNEDIRDLKYVLNVNHKGYLWWKKPIYETYLSDILTFIPNEAIRPLYQGDNKLKEELLTYIDNKLGNMGVFIRDVMPDKYTMSINSSWKDEELDKAVNRFITTIIRYK